MRKVPRLVVERIPISMDGRGRALVVVRQSRRRWEDAYGTPGFWCWRRRMGALSSATVASGSKVVRAGRAVGGAASGRLLHCRARESAFAPKQTHELLPIRHKGPDLSLRWSASGINRIRFFFFFTTKVCS